MTCSDLEEIVGEKKADHETLNYYRIQLEKKDKILYSPFLLDISQSSKEKIQEL